MFLPDPLEGFSPEMYVAALAEVAHSDGLHATEMAILEEHAKRFGIDLDRLPALTRRSFGPARSHPHPRVPGCVHAGHGGR